jgi:glycosyltransferase involved in cell wall biosynthesis
MLAAVVPVRNEETRVGRLLLRLVNIESIHHIFIILNGSNSSTVDEVDTFYHQNPDRITVAQFRDALGIDVPRAIGAHMAYTCGMSHTLFVDGDLVGQITTELQSFIQATLTRQLDLALTNCYPDGPFSGTSSEPMFYFRRLLNRELGFESKLGIASPSHGPHIISRRFISLIPWIDLAVPPTLLVYAKKYNLINVSIAGTIPHVLLGSSVKDQRHSELIIDTIAGDCLEALCLYRNQARQRIYNNQKYLGYNKDRRFDLLREYLAGRYM